MTLSSPVDCRKFERCCCCCSDRRQMLSQRITPAQIAVLFVIEFPHHGTAFVARVRCIAANNVRWILTERSARGRVSDFKSYEMKRWFWSASGLKMIRSTKRNISLGKVMRATRTFIHHQAKLDVADLVTAWSLRAEKLVESPFPPCRRLDYACTKAWPLASPGRVYDTRTRRRALHWFGWVCNVETLQFRLECCLGCITREVLMEDAYAVLANTLLYFAIDIAEHCC
ncbi:hypothetical protein DVH05_026755 [Phytophthora capsici]|nr:hypothetical protein DVH05_026755 [Phytophthora capsici]